MFVTRRASLCTTVDKNATTYCTDVSACPVLTAVLRAWDLFRVNGEPWARCSFKFISNRLAGGEGLQKGYCAPCSGCSLCCITNSANASASMIWNRTSRIHSRQAQDLGRSSHARVLEGTGKDEGNSLSNATHRLGHSPTRTGISWR